MSLITPDSGLVIWMTIIFAIVFFILAKFGFPIITSSVKKRSAKINDSLRAAEEAQQQLATLAQQQEEILADTRVKQAALLKEAAAARDAMVEQAKEQARDEASKIIQDAKVQIAAEREAAIQDIRRQVALLSVDVAEKIIRKDLSGEKAQLDLLDRLADEASSSHLNS